jgi:YihY family inner membrane protein
MASAEFVPQTASMAEGELSGDDAAAALRRVGTKELIKESIARYRAGDGTSSARALGYQIVLTVIPLTIAFVGLSSVIKAETLSKAIEETILSLAPGASGDLLAESLRSSAESGGAGGAIALVVGLLTGLLALTVAMSQIERGANRIYGMQDDRPLKERYGKGAVLGVTAGLPALIGFVLLVAGRAGIEAFGAAFEWDDWAITTLTWLRWPVGALLCWMALTVIFEKAPKRQQPSKTWLAYGAGLALVLWLVFSGLLALYVMASSGFGQLYGPLTGVIALLIWAQLTSIALYFGLAFAAQLEYIRVPRTGTARAGAGVSEAGRARR